MAAQDLAERLDAFEPAPDDHDLAPAATRGDLGETLADARALVHRLERVRVLRDAFGADSRCIAHAEQVTAYAERILAGEARPDEIDREVVLAAAVLVTYLVGGPLTMVLTIR